ncbi:MAG: hypothetical protein IT430_14345 [Phycisphaerales bacterium]|nr:hypothetical protein [Phycisphaerales bacterium]
MLSEVYVVTLFLASLANYDYYKTSGSIGLRPFGILELPYELAGFGAWILIALLFVAGFFALPWWVPPLAVFGCAGFAGYVYWRVPLSATYAIVGFPLAVIGAIAFVAIAFF